MSEDKNKKIYDKVSKDQDKPGGKYDKDTKASLKRQDKFVDKAKPKSEDEK